MSGAFSNKLHPIFVSAVFLGSKNVVRRTLKPCLSLCCFVVLSFAFKRFSTFVFMMVNVEISVHGCLFRSFCLGCMAIFHNFVVLNTLQSRPIPIMVMVGWDDFL